MLLPPTLGGCVDKQAEAIVAPRVTDGSIIRLLREIAEAACGWPEPEHLVELVLRRMSEHHGWSFGHAFFRSESSDELLPALAYFSGNPERFRRFRELSVRLRIKRGQGLPGRVLASRRAEWTVRVQDDLSSRRAELAIDEGIKTALAFPILVGSEVVGVLEFFSDRRIEPDDDTLTIMGSIGLQLGRVVERQRFEVQLANAVLAEQHRLAADLHDNVGQILVGLGLSADRLVRQLRERMPREAERAAALADGIRESIQLIRSVARGLLPNAVDRATLCAALDQLMDKTRDHSGVECILDVGTLYEVDSNLTATTLYRIAQEAVRNAVRHARPRTVLVRLRSDDTSLALEVSDDGVGISDQERPLPGLGIRLMRHQAALVDGTFSIQRGEKCGTIVAVNVPMTPAARERRKQNE